MKINKSNSIKITSLGGFGDVNRNMFVYEQPDGGDILLVDCGIGFPNEEMLGVDLLIPDIHYLRDKQDRIQGLILTHGHEDHIGALPYVLPNFDVTFPVYGSRLTAALANEKLNEYKIKNKVREFRLGNTLNLGSFTITGMRVSHSIPDTFHYYIQTKYASIYHGTDFKFDWTPIDGKAPEVGKIATAGNDGVDLLVSDCLGSERKGATRSELELNEMFEREIRDCKGKFIVTAMSSSISRLQQVVTVSLERGRKVVPVGRSIEKNLKIARELGYLKINDNDLVPYNKTKSIPDKTLTFLVAGSQGQTGSALQRIAGGEHRFVKIHPGDKVVFSTDYIPGSETSIHAAIDALYKEGATVVYADIKDDLHVSGHGSQADLKLLLELTRPKSALPIGGAYRHMVHYRMLAENMGFSPKHILMPKPNQVIYVNKQGGFLGDIVDIRNVMIDGLGIGDVGKVVLRDRQVLAEEGVVVVLLQLDMQTKKLVSDPDIITRGFVYVKSHDSMISQSKSLVKRELVSGKHNMADWHLVKDRTVKVLQRYFAKELDRHPMILPVIIEV